MPEDTITTSWKRSTDKVREAARQATTLATWEDEGGTAASVEQAEDLTPGSMPRILIVDDGVQAADSLASLLQSAGYGDARVAYTGATTLELAREAGIERYLSKPVSSAALAEVFA